MSSSIVERLRQDVDELHRKVEDNPFMQELLEGNVYREVYADYLARLWWIYDAIEKCIEMDKTSTLEPIYAPQLYRKKAIESDLSHFVGPDWEEFVDQVQSPFEYIDSIWESPAYLVAVHAYVRYLGDLSGGLIIRKRLEKHYGSDGLEFYHFDFDSFPFEASVRDVKEAFKMGMDRIFEESDSTYEEWLETAQYAFEAHDDMFNDLYQKNEQLNAMTSSTILPPEEYSDEEHHITGASNEDLTEHITGASN